MVEQESVWIKTYFEFMTRTPHIVLEDTIIGLEQCLAHACVFRLIEEGHVAITTVVHVDDTFAVGLKSTYDRFSDKLNPLVPG